MFLQIRLNKKRKPNINQSKKKIFLMEMFFFYYGQREKTRFKSSSSFFQLKLNFSHDDQSKTLREVNFVLVNTKVSLILIGHCHILRLYVFEADRFCIDI